MTVRRLKELLNCCNDDTNIVIEYKDGVEYLTRDIDFIKYTITSNGVYYKIYADKWFSYSEEFDREDEVIL